MTDLSGQYLGRYYLSERLGEGGMAVVYKAHDTRLERDVAIKIIRSGAFPPDALGEVLKRFEREAKSLAKLSHPNIVKVYDYGEHEGEPYLVMEYLSGGTLKKNLGKPIPWPDAVRLILPVARGVAYAHQRGILHRDIKPANVLITENGEPMLSDFGIAKLFEGNQTTALTGSGMAVGTPEYMAPEQWTGLTSPQSDLYSLGIVLYEMVTGRKPYVADTPAAILIKQATEPLPTPRKFVVDLPEVLELVLVKALAKEPADRYKNLNAFVSALENLLVGMPVVSQPSEEKYIEETYKVPSQKPMAPVSAQTLSQDDGKTERAVEATEKDWRERSEREATENAIREKVKREREEHQTDHKTTLAKTLSKSKSVLRVAGLVGIIIALLWVGSWAIPKLPLLAATKTLTASQRPTIIISSTHSPLPPTVTSTSPATITPIPSATVAVLGEAHIDWASIPSEWGRDVFKDALIIEKSEYFDYVNAEDIGRAGRSDVLIDGDPFTGWDTSSGRFPHWIIFELNNEEIINRIGFVNHITGHRGILEGNNSTKDIEVYVAPSDAPNDFKKLGEFTLTGPGGNPPEPYRKLQPYSFEPVRVKYVKVIIKSSYFLPSLTTEFPNLLDFLGAALAEIALFPAQ